MVNRKKPSTSQTPGEAFLASVEAMFDVEDSGPAWIAQLNVAAATIDLVHDLEVLVEHDGLMVDGLHQRVVHPAVKELRAQRIALARILQGLGLDQDEGSQSERQRRNARQRWKRT